MVLMTFPYLCDNSKLIRHGSTLYKVKFKYIDMPPMSKRPEGLNNTLAHQEIEQCLRALLYMNERNIPFKPVITKHFLICPRKESWSFLKKYGNYGFAQNGEALKTYHSVLELDISFHNKKSEVPKSVSHPSTDPQASKAVIDVTKGELPWGNVPVGRFTRNPDGQLCRVVSEKQEKTVNIGEIIKTVVEKRKVVKTDGKNEKTVCGTKEQGRVNDKTISTQNTRHKNKSPIKTDTKMLRKSRIRQRKSEQRLDLARAMRSNTRTFEQGRKSVPNRELRKRSEKPGRDDSLSEGNTETTASEGSPVKKKARREEVNTRNLRQKPKVIEDKSKGQTGSKKMVEQEKGEDKRQSKNSMNERRQQRSLVSRTIEIHGNQSETSDDDMGRDTMRRSSRHIRQPERYDSQRFQAAGEVVSSEETDSDASQERQQERGKHKDVKSGQQVNTVKSVVDRRTSSRQIRAPDRYDAEEMDLHDRERLREANRVSGTNKDTDETSSDDESEGKENFSLVDKKLYNFVL